VVNLQKIVETEGIRMGAKAPLSSNQLARQFSMEVTDLGTHVRIRVLSSEDGRGMRRSLLNRTVRLEQAQRVIRRLCKQYSVFKPNLSVVEQDNDRGAAP